MWLVTREESAAEFELPVYTPRQRKVLQTAFNQIGYPYVWGGTSGGEQSLFGVRSRGGFDCSGFVWRVYKLEPYAGGERLDDTLRGRRPDGRRGSEGAAHRVREPSTGRSHVLRAGGRRARAASVDHMGVYAGNGWMIHSSRYGVALARVDGWYEERFAWGRRPLAEADLT